MTTQRQDQRRDLPDERRSKWPSRTRWLIASVILLFIVVGIIIWILTSQSVLTTILPIVIFTVLGILIALFRVIKTLDVRSTTSDQTLIDAMNFIMAHEHDPKKYLEATIDLSFASAKWQRTVVVRRKPKSWFIRQHLETCVFSYVAEELKTGDLGVVGSQQFADYRDHPVNLSRYMWNELQVAFTASQARQQVFSSMTYTSA